MEIIQFAAVAFIYGIYIINWNLMIMSISAGMASLYITSVPCGTVCLNCLKHIHVGMAGSQGSAYDRENQHQDETQSN